MAISTEKLLTLSQFQTGLQASKNYTDTKATELQTNINKKADQTSLDTTNGKVATLESQMATAQQDITDNETAINNEVTRAKAAEQANATAAAEAKSAAEAAQSAADKAQEEVDALELKVATAEGNIATNSGDITTMKGQIAALEAGTYDDTEVRGLISANADAIDAIEADYLKAADIANKADKATTLAGYGIEDAYTKSEVDGLVASTFHYKGTVATYAELPTEGMAVGDVYNITAADKDNGIKAGDNVAWNGTGWDVLAGTVDLSAYSTTEEINAAIAAANADKIALTNLSVETTGTGNAVTAVSYDNTTGKFTVTKGATYLTEADVTINVATDDEVTAVCTAVFGA